MPMRSLLKPEATIKLMSGPDQMEGKSVAAYQYLESESEINPV